MPLRYYLTAIKRNRNIALNYVIINLRRRIIIYLKHLYLKQLFVTINIL